MKNFIVAIFCLLLVVVGSFAKKYSPDDEGFVASNRYYESDLITRRANLTKLENKISKESDKLRFGLPAISTPYGNTGNGVQYGPSNVGFGLAPMKVDLGGIAIGALIGFSAILLIPKIAHLFSGGTGYRSLEGEMSAFTDVLARIDNSLEQHNIDSSSCMQRIICTYVNEAEKNMRNGEATTVDQFIYAMTNNSLFSFMLDGSAIKQAVEMGKSSDPEKCTALYAKCPISRENVLKVMASLLPA